MHGWKELEKKKKKKEEEGLHVTCFDRLMRDNGKKNMEGIR